MTRYSTTRCLRSGHFEDSGREPVVDTGQALFAHDGLDAVEEALEARPTLLHLELVINQLDLDRLLVRVKVRVSRRRPRPRSRSRPGPGPGQASYLALTQAVGARLRRCDDECLNGASGEAGEEGGGGALRLFGLPPEPLGLRVDSTHAIHQVSALLRSLSPSCAPLRCHR